MNDKKFADAVKAYQTAYNSCSDQEHKAEARYQTGLAWFRSGDFDQAHRTLEEVTRSWPASSYAAEALYLSGRARFRASRFEEAISSFDQLIRSYPKSALVDDATYAIADCHYNLGAYDKAIAQYRKLIEAYPKSELVADALTGLQWSMMQKGETGQADKVVQEYVTRLPDRETAAKVLERQAEFLRDNARYDEAIEQYQKLLSSYGSTTAGAAAWYGIALCRQSQNQPDAAIAAFRQQWEKNPDSPASPQALFAGARLLAERGENTQAASWYSKLTTTYADHELSSAAAYARGVLDIDGEQIDQAERYFKELDSTDKNNAERGLARLGLARVHIGKKQYADAQAILDQLLEQGTPAVSAEAQFLIATILREQKELAKASLAFLKIKYLYPDELDWVVSGIYNAARCNEELGRTADARRLYQSLVNDYPARSDYAARARERLQALAGK